MPILPALAIQFQGLFPSSDHGRERARWFLPVKTREIAYLLFKQRWAPPLPILQGLNGREMP